MLNHQHQHVLILGGDMRQYYMAKFLARDNFAISYFGQLFEEEEEGISKIRTLEKLKEQLGQIMFDYIILPVPVGEEYVRGTDNLIRNMELAEWIKGQNKAVIMGGKIPKNLCLELDKMKKTVIDFMKEESIAIMNGRLTAENAIIEAIMMSNMSVINAECLVIGYGRCGRMIADELRGMGARVTVAEPQEERAMLAISYGYRVEEIEELGKYQFIFQTAPKQGILTDRLLLTCLVREPENMTVILDISGFAGSVDFAFCDKNQILCKPCPALPGKYTAKSAGEVLGKFVSTKSRK